jgi:hypothetical protein
MVMLSLRRFWSLGSMVARRSRNWGEPSLYFAAWMFHGINNGIGSYFGLIYFTHGPGLCRQSALYKFKLECLSFWLFQVHQEAGYFIPLQSLKASPTTFGYYRIYHCPIAGFWPLVINSLVAANFKGF